MSQSTAEKKTNSEHPSMTAIFWLIIILGILSISLFAGWLASRGGVTQTTPESPEKSAQVSPLPPAETFSKTALGWKTMAQQVQQTELKTLQMLASALDKLPDLAPLPRPNLPAPVKTAPPSPIAWKLLSEQLAVTEQQQVMMLQNFLAKAEK